MDIEINKAITFFDALVTRKVGSVITTEYRKPTHTGQYINYEPNHSEYVKRGVIKTLYTRAVNIFSNENLLRK